MKLLEGAKISNQLVAATLNNPEFTFGFEAEFFYTDIDDFMRDYFSKDTKLGDDGWYTKKLNDTRWHDVVMFFYPMDVPESLSFFSNPEIMVRRLHNVFLKLTDFDVGGDETWPSDPEMFDTIKSQLQMPTIMAALKIYPENGMVLSEPQERSVKSVIQRGDVDKASTLGKLGEYSYRTSQLMKTQYDSDDVRGVFYEMFSSKLSEYLGETVDFVTSDDGIDPATQDYSTWIVMPDASLTQVEMYTKDIIGIEIISPVMQLKNGLESMEKIFNVISNPSIIGFDELQGKTTFETGFHINLGIGNKPIDYLKLIMLMGDRHTLEQYGRWTTEHAEPILATLVDTFNSDPKRAVPILNQFIKKIGVSSESMNDAIELLKKNVSRDKFQSVNLGKLTSGYIEFRAAGGKDYHKDFDKVRRTVLSLAVWMYVATEPEIYKNEYYKAVIRFVKMLETGENEFLDRTYLNRLARERGVDIDQADNEQQLNDSTGWGMHVGPTGRRGMEPTGYMDSMWVSEPANNDGYHPGNSEDDLELP